MDENELKRLLSSQLEVLRELRAHVVVIKRVLRDRGLISDADYLALLESVRSGFEEMELTAQRERVPQPSPGFMTPGLGGRNNSTQKRDL